MTRYPRDLRGYGPRTPDPKWPGGAKIAVQFVINFEEGGENCILHGDPASEAFLSEIAGAVPWPGARHANMESIYEYGARVGFWRLHRLFTDLDMPATVYGVATALARCPEQVAAMQAADWEIASHGLKWIDYRDMDPGVEQAQMHEAIRLHTEVTGARPRGWYTGRSSINTVSLATREGGFDYIADSYADDLPYWIDFDGNDQLIVPYTLDCNDMRFASSQGFVTGDDFYSYLKDSFDVLYSEGQAGQAKMMSIGLHCRLVGRPGRLMALRRFMNHARAHDDVWFARRIDIARHWRNQHPQQSRKRPSRMRTAELVALFGDVYGAVDWVAENACALELGPAHDSLPGLLSALNRGFRKGSAQQKLAVLNAQPETHDAILLAPHTSGTDLTQDMRVAHLSAGYRAKHGFPVFIATSAVDAHAIASQIETRTANDTAAEFQRACDAMEKLAEQRLADVFAAL
ncbi:allantoinase PuuE [Roseovarius aestuarii]|nr:allantoinase PuuE [Roseovarius aestuarii]